MRESGGASLKGRDYAADDRVTHETCHTHTHIQKHSEYSHKTTLHRYFSKVASHLPPLFHQQGKNVKKIRDQRTQRY